MQIKLMISGSIINISAKISANDKIRKIKMIDIFELFFYWYVIIILNSDQMNEIYKYY